ncbi:MAG TPA: hypothetical protein VGP72_31125 [Planctomycetota bacterium]
MNLSLPNAILCNLHNYGVVNAASGELQFPLSASYAWNELGGTLTSEPGAKIVLPAGGWLHNSGTLAGTLDVLGNLMQEANSSCNGTLNVGGFGGIGGFNALTINGTANVSDMAGFSAQIGISGSGTLNFLPNSQAQIWNGITPSGTVNLTDACVWGPGFIAILPSSTLTSQVLVNTSSAVQCQLLNVGAVNAASGELQIGDGTPNAYARNESDGTCAEGAKVVITTGSTLYNCGMLSGTVDVCGTVVQEANSTCTGMLNLSGSTNGTGVLTIDGTANVSGAWLNAP